MVVKGFDFSKHDSVKNAESNEQEEHFYRYVKAGETITVGLLQPSEYAQVPVYDVYPLTSTVGIPQEDLFKKAKAEVMRLADIEKAKSLGYDPDSYGIKQAAEDYKNMSDNDKEAYKLGAGKEWYRLIKEAYRLAEQVRFLFAFYDFETGSPFVIQTTKKQAEGIYKKIAAAWTAEEGEAPEAEEYAFTISKGTGGFALDINTKKKVFKLSEEDQEKHAEWRTQQVTEEQFDNAHFKLSTEAQKEVIKTFASDKDGFDLSKVIGTVEEKPQEESPKNDDPFSDTGKPLDISTDDLPF